MRDHEGLVVLAGAGNFESVRNALCAEAQACLAAITVAAGQGMLQI